MLKTQDYRLHLMYTESLILPNVYAKSDYKQILSKYIAIKHFQRKMCSCITPKACYKYIFFIYFKDFSSQHNRIIININNNNDNKITV